MKFDKAIEIVKENLIKIGTEININNYDGIIIKKLGASNTWDENRDSKQTHIAITGDQMDIFPYLKSEGYFNNNDATLKKYFLLQIPVKLKKENLNYLDSKISERKHDINSYTSVIRTKRKNQADQIQISLKNYDDADFKVFRNAIHENDMLIILKKEKEFEYEFYGIKKEDINNSILELNNKFINRKTITVVEVNDLINSGKNQFEKWLQESNDIKILKESARRTANALKQICYKFDINNIYEVTDVNQYEQIMRNIKGSEKYNDEKKACVGYENNIDSALNYYKKFLEENFNIYNTNLKTEYYHNRILFGAPGTGKSYDLDRDKDKLLEKGGLFERVTFHPDYSYSQFVGTYKPVTNEHNQIDYKYVPGPFMRTYVEAIKSAKSAVPKPHLLIIEEINRANVAAVFGDVFQLLDRDKQNVSTYPIQATEDMRNYLVDELGGILDNYKTIKIPNNMFIWATMNSADQGVFPMDTAFKRRWNFTYLGIDEKEEKIKKYKIKIGKNVYNWNDIRKEINNVLLEECNVNEDKLIGPYFISKKILENSEKDNKEFTEVFKNKVIMYLFDDAAKYKRAKLFSGCSTSNVYSKICQEFDEKGISIFSEKVQNNVKKYNNTEKEKTNNSTNDSKVSLSVVEKKEDYGENVDE